LKPNAIWDGNPDFDFEIKGCLDSDYAKDPELQHSVNGYCTFLNVAPVNAKSKMQQCVTLSVIEDNKRAKDHIENWSVGRRAWHVDVCKYSLGIDEYICNSLRVLMNLVGDKEFVEFRRKYVIFHNQWLSKHFIHSIQRNHILNMNLRPIV
jgi:hypothetical protein